MFGFRQKTSRIKIEPHFGPNRNPRQSMVVLSYTENPKSIPISTSRNEDTHDNRELSDSDIAGIKLLYQDIIETEEERRAMPWWKRLNN